MAKRVVVFVDYQNAYRAARNAFHNHLSDPHWAGQIHPTQVLLVALVLQVLLVPRALLVEGAAVLITGLKTLFLRQTKGF